MKKLNSVVSIIVTVFVISNSFALPVLADKEANFSRQVVNKAQAGNSALELEKTKNSSLGESGYDSFKQSLAKEKNVETDKLQQNGTMLKNYVEGEILVKYKKNKINLETSSGRVAAENFVKAKAVEKKEDLRKNNISVLKIKDSKTVDQKIAELKNDPNVEYVQPNFQYYPLSIDSNDTFKNNLWGLDNTGQIVNGVTGINDADIDAPEAWAINEVTNDSVIVAVIDSGVAYNHPDLVGNMWDGTVCVGEDSDGNPISGGCNHGYDYEDNDKTPLPTNSSHGTHIAGTIAAAKNNNSGIMGIAPNAKIMAIKMRGDTAQTIKSINFTQQNGAKIINYSWATTDYDPLLKDAIALFPGLFITAAGNGEFYGDLIIGDDNDSQIHLYPSDYDLDNIISATATDQSDNLSPFSNYGAISVDVGAPGTNIYSTVSGSSIDGTPILFQTFDSITPPSIPSGWTKEGTNNYWGTLDRTTTWGSAWGKVLYADLNYPYLNNANTAVISPAYNLANATGATIDFWTKCDSEYTGYAANTFYDYLAIDYSSDGINFYEVLRWDEPYIDWLNGDSDSEGWATYHFKNFPVQSGYLTANFKFRLRWVTDSSLNNYDGCSVDDLKITKYSDGSDEGYDYNDGTSFAAPHVAGLAALIWGTKPELTYAEVKNTILTTGDDLVSLAGKTVTGKRINAYKALGSLTNNIITQDTTWIQDNSPYIFEENDLQVAQGATLTMEEGVEVKMGEWKKIVVAGNLNVNGSQNLPVKFTSINENSKWWGIEFVNSDDSNIDNTVIENANRAIDLKGNSLVNFIGNIFRHNDWAITDTNGYQNMQFLNNTFSNNGDVFYGIRTSGNENRFENNIFNGNNNVFSHGYYFGHTTITNNNFLDNNFVIKAPENGYGYGTVDIKNNWWNTSDTNIIDGYIEDGNDDVTLQILDYNPIKNSEINEIGSPIILDTNPPVITLLGTSPINLYVGEIYIDAGSTALDDIDGDITVNIITVNPVDTNVAGTYIITYNVSDSAGNPATQLTRTVNVIANPAKAITAFNFTEGSGIIDESSHTIAVAIPFDTDITALTPTITITGISVSPLSGVAQDFTNPVTYTVTAADSSTQVYIVTVTVVANPDIAAAQVVIDQISALPTPANLVIGDATAVTNAREAYDVLTEPQKGLVTNLVVLTAAENQIVALTTTTTKVTELETAVAKDLTIEADLTTAESALTAAYSTFASVVAGGAKVDLANRFNTASETVASAALATDKAALVDSMIQGENVDLSHITTALTNPLPASGSHGSGISWASSNTVVVSNDGQIINRPVYADGDATVTLTASISRGILVVCDISGGSDGGGGGGGCGAGTGTTKSFSLTVLKLPASTVATITSATYTVSSGGTAAETITNIPFDTAKTTFLAAIGKGEAHQTWVDTGISDPVVTGNTLVVTAQDGTTIVIYTVIAALNPAKSITSFNFASPSVMGVINETAHTITITVPYGTDVTALAPTIATSTGATVSPASGIAQDFTNPVTYTVIAADTTTQTYIVTVNMVTATQTVPTEDGTATANSTTPQVVVSSPTQAVTVTVSSGTSNASINYGSLISGGTGTIPQTTIDSASADIFIPGSTVVTSASTTWDGIITAPTVTNVTLPETSGQTKTLSTAIEIGFTGAKLSFDKAVRILLPGQAGKRAGYVRTGITFTEITNICVADNQITGDALAADGDCKIDVSSDLVIWTKHFTSFATYTQTAIPTPTPASSGGGGGGGGGGSFVSLPTNYSIKINNNATSTDNRNVQLTLAATNASQMMISNNSTFNGGSFETYATTKNWTLTEGVGQKTVYARFRSSSGGTADASDSINLTASVLLPLSTSTPSTNNQQGQVLGAQQFAEGALIRAKGDVDVYVVKYMGNKQFKRLILSPSVFKNYRHLKWENVIEVEKSIADSFVTSELVRANGDYKVYKLYPQGDTGQKRWIKTAEVFGRMGFDWDAVYEINKFDRDSYVTGVVLE